MDDGLGYGEWLNIAERGEFVGKTISKVSNYPRWDAQERASVVTFEFTDGTTADLLIFRRGNLGEAPTETNG